MVTIVTIIHPIIATIFTTTITLLIHTGVGDTTTMDLIIQVITMDIMTDTMVDTGTITMETIIMETETIMVTVEQDQQCHLMDHRIVTLEHQPGKTIVQTIQDTELAVPLQAEHKLEQLDQQQTMEVRV